MTAQPAYAPISIGRDEYHIPGLSVERLRMGADPGRVAGAAARFASNFG